MAKFMHMEKNMISDKIIDRQRTAKVMVLIRNSFMSKQNPSYNSLKKKMIIKDAKYKSGGAMRGKIIAENTNKTLISRRRKGYPAASASLLGLLLGPFFDCVTIQGLNFSGFLVVIVAVVVAAIFLRLLENLKLWERLMMHQFKAKKRAKHKPRDEIRSTAVGRNRKWTWIEDLLSGVDVSGIDDLFISICFLMGLGFLSGFVLLFRRFYSENLRK